MIDGDQSANVQIGGDLSGQVGVGGTVIQSQTDDAPARGDSPITVLFWASNPIETEPLRLGEEVRTIDERLRGSTYAHRFDLEQQWAVRYTDLSEGLFRHAPHIVHFSGHGAPDGRLVTEDNNGESHEIGIQALADLFRIAGDEIRCVVFNACYSTDQAEAVAEHVDCVVGTFRAIADRSALAFAGGFYRALGYGRSVQSAFDLGRNEINLAGLDDHEVPQLHTKSGVDAATVAFA
jgi:hypothetical protein